MNGFLKKLTSVSSYFILFGICYSSVCAFAQNGDLHLYLTEQLLQAEHGKDTATNTFKLSVDDESSFDLPAELSYTVGIDFLPGGKPRTLTQLREVLTRSSFATVGSGQTPRGHIAFSTASALQLVSGSDSCRDCSVVNAITQGGASAIAQYQLGSLLMQPMTDIEVLERRKSLIKNILDNSRGLTYLQEQMMVIRQTEPYVIDLLARDSALFNDVFTQTVVNQGSAGLVSLLPYAETVVRAASWVYLAGNVYRVGRQAYTHWSLANLCSPLTMLYATYVVASYAIGPLISQLGAQAVELFASANWRGPTLRYGERLTRLQDYVAAVRKLFAFIQSYGLTDTLVNTSVISALEQPNSYLSLLLQDIELGRLQYTKKANSRVKELRMIELLQHVHSSDVFTEFMKAAGEIEAWFHVALLMSRKPHGSQAVYSLADYIEDDEPVVILKKFWNPLVGQKRSITNKFGINSATPRIYVVSGPNAGGKTTAINGIAHSILMAQTLAVVPARKMQLTPFSIIETSRVRQGSNDTGLSSYQAETESAFAFMNDSFSAEEEAQKVFIFIDEPFVGTNCDSAEKATKALLEVLGEQQHTIAMTTYHPCVSIAESNSDYSPIWLVKNHPKTYGGLQVKAQLGEGGKISYDYKLHPGISNQSVGLDIFDSHPNTPKPFLDKVHQYRKHPAR